MTLKQATDLANAAIDAGDLEELSRALAARRQALDAGEKPTLEILQAGERAVHALKALAQHLAFESTRVAQIKRYVDFRR